MGQPFKKIIVLMSLIAIMIAASVTWRYYHYHYSPTIRVMKSQSPISDSSKATSAPAATERQRLAATPAASTTPAFIFDYDLDGLFDDLEKTYGTDPARADTDGDGLDDYAETMVWQTDPLRADTDGDGHSDGEEVKNKFNPKGDGPLKN